MKKPDDALSRLRGANPVPPEEAPPADSPQAAALFERIVATPPEAASPSPARPRRRVFRRRLWILIPAVAVAGAAGYAATHRGKPVIGIVCYPHANVETGGALVDPVQGDATRACDFLWATGQAFNPTGSTPEPTLTACVNADGVIDVVPDTHRPDTCGYLGLDALTGGANLQNDALARLKEAIGTALSDSCYTAQESRAIAQRLLEQSGVTGWTVELVTDYPETEPCGSVAFEVKTNTIRLPPSHGTQGAP